MKKIYASFLIAIALGSVTGVSLAAKLPACSGVCTDACLEKLKANRGIGTVVGRIHGTSCYCFSKEMGTDRGDELAKFPFNQKCKL